MKKVLAIFVLVGVLSFSFGLSSSYASVGLELLQSAVNTANQQVYTFSSQNLGTASSDRYIIVSVLGRDSGTGGTSVTAVSVAGVSADLVVNRSNNAVNSSVAALYIAAVPSGTSGDIVITFNTTMVNAAYIAYRATGIEVLSVDSDSSVADDPSVNLDVPVGGFAIGSGVSVSASAGWSGLVEDVDVLLEGAAIYTGANDEFPSGASGQSIMIDFAGTPVDSVGVFASWEPSDPPVFPSVSGAPIGSFLIVGSGSVIGIASTTALMFDDSSGNVFIGTGLILSSPNGSCHTVGVTDAGVLFATSTTCL